MLINSLTEPIKHASPNLPESNVNRQRRVPKMQGKLLDFGMRKHLVEEIATSQKVQTKQPVCLSSRRRKSAEHGRARVSSVVRVRSCDPKGTEQRLSSL